MGREFYVRRFLPQMMIAKGAIIWAVFLCILLGVLIVLAGIFGRAFYVGMNPRARVPVPTWQGRTWLVVSGSLIVLMGAAGIFGTSDTGLRHFLERSFVIFDFGYEMFGGGIAALVGLGFLLPGKDEVGTQARLMGAGAIFFAVVLIMDALWKMYR